MRITKLRSGVGTLIAVAVFGVSCGGSAPSAKSDIPRRFEAVAMVLDSPTRGAMLCVGITYLTDPPTCGDVPLRGWDWDGHDFHSATGADGGLTRWGTYRIRGDLRDGVFFVADARDAPTSKEKARWELLCKRSHACQPDRTLSREESRRIYQELPSFAAAHDIEVISVGEPAGKPQPLELHVLVLDNEQRLSLIDKFGSGRLRVAVSLIAL